MNKKIDIIGHAAYDYFFTVAKHPRNDETSYIHKIEKHFGGGAANIALGLSKLGIKSRLHTVAGCDFKRYESFLKKNDVELRLIKSKEKTPCAYIYNAEGNQKTYFFWGASEEMNRIESISSKYLHIAPCHPSTALNMAKKAKYFSFEPGQDLRRYDYESLQYLTEKADIIFCNKKEFHELQKIVSLESKNVIVTQGDKGSLVCKDNIKIPSLSVQSIDSTGAGDAYKAGFWAAYLRNFDVESSCKIAATTASFVVEKIGAQWIPTWNIVMDRYVKYFKEK